MADPLVAKISFSITHSKGRARWPRWMPIQLAERRDPSEGGVGDVTGVGGEGVGQRWMVAVGSYLPVCRAKAHHACICCVIFMNEFDGCVGRMAGL